MSVEHTWVDITGHRRLDIKKNNTYLTSQYKK